MKIEKVLPSKSVVHIMSPTSEDAKENEMRITSVSVTQRTNTGQYEHLEFNAQAVIAEDESIGEATNKLMSYVDWYAQKPIRDERARQQRLIAKDENAPEDKRAAAEQWLRVYEARKAEVEAI